MAIKRTILRQNFVTNTAMPESAGLAMAQASREIAGAITSITNTVDKSQLNNAILEAESQGIQLGSRKDKNNMPVPITQEEINNYNPNIYNKGNYRQVRERLKELATTTFGMNLANTAYDSAEKSLLANRGNFKLLDDGTLEYGVASDYKGFIEGYKGKVSEEIWNRISPNIDKIWKGQIRQASAIHHKKMRTENYNGGINALNNLVKLESTTIIAGYAKEEIEEIQKDKEEIFKVLYANTDDKTKVDDLNTIYNSNLQSMILENAITVGDKANLPISELREMVVNTSQNFKNNETVNSEIIEKEGNILVNKISKMRLLEKAENNAQSKESLTNMLLGLREDKVPTATEISQLTPSDQLLWDIQSSFYEITESNKQSKKLNDGVKKLLIGYSNAVVTDEDKPNDNFLVSEFETGPRDNETLLRKKKETLLEEINSFRDYEQLSLVNLNVITNIEKSYADSLIKLENDNLDAQYQSHFQGIHGFSLSPNLLASEKYISSLEKKGFVGIGPNAKYTRSTWIKAVGAYQLKWKTHNKDVKTLNNVSVKVSKGLKINKEEIKVLRKHMSPNIIVNGESVERDILSNNSIVSSESIKAEARFVKTTNGISTEAKDLLNNVLLVENEDSFNKIKQTWLSIKDVFYNADEPVLAKFKLNNFAKENGIDISKFQGIQFYDSFKDYQTAYNGSTAQRNLSWFFPNQKDLNENDILNEALPPIFDELDDGMFVKYFSGLEAKDSTIIDNLRGWVQKYGTGNLTTGLSEIVIANDGIRSLIINDVKRQIAKGDIQQNALGLQTAILTSLNNFNGRLSINAVRQNDDSLDYVLSSGNWLADAQETSVGGIEITEEMVKEDIKDKFNITFSADKALDQTPGLRTNFESGNFVFVGNSNALGTETYRVVVPSEDGSLITIVDNYRYDYKLSKDHKIFTDAVSKLEDPGVRSFFNSISFLSKSNLNAVMDTLRSNKSTVETWNGIKSIYNTSANFLNNLPRHPNNMFPLIEKGNNDKELEELFDSLRLLRLDLR